MQRTLRTLGLSTLALIASGATLQKPEPAARIVDAATGEPLRAQTIPSRSERVIRAPGYQDVRIVTSAGPGMTLGEMSMIDGEPRFATCMASQPTTFAVLTRDSMAKIILDYPGLGSKILIKMVTMLSLRLRQTSARLLRVMDENR